MIGADKQHNSIDQSSALLGNQVYDCETHLDTPSTLIRIGAAASHPTDRLSSATVESSSMREAPTQNAVARHGVIKTLLNRRLNDIAKYVHGDDILDLSGDNPISNPKNAKLILSILSHDERYSAVNKLTCSNLNTLNSNQNSNLTGNQDMTLSSDSNHLFENEPLNDVCDTIKQVIRAEVTDPNFQESDDIYSKSDLKKMLRRPLLQIGKFKLQVNCLGLSRPALSKVQTELSSLTDRPITRITRVGAMNEHTMQQLPASIFEENGIAETTFGISHNSKTELNEQVNNALMVQYEGRTAIRSARTETESAVKQLALLNIQQEHLVNKGEAELGIKPSDKPLKFAIFSALDGITEKFRFGIPGIVEVTDGEKEMFSNIERSIEKIWGDADSKIFTLNIDGKPVTRQVAKPMLFNLVLSNTSKDSKAIIRAREHNAAQCCALVETLSEKYLTANRTPPKNPLQALKSLAEESKNLSLKYAVEALEVMNSSTKLTKKEDPLKECLLMHFLMREMGINENFQCKSGQDRTPAMLAMTKAIEFIEDIYTETEVPKLSEVNGQLTPLSQKEVSDKVFNHMSTRIDEILNYTPTNSQNMLNSEGELSESACRDSANISAFKSLFSTILRDCAYEPTILVRKKPVLKNNSRTLGLIETPHHSTNAFVDWSILTGQESRSRHKTHLAEPNANQNAHQADISDHSSHSDISEINLDTSHIPLS